MPCFLFHKIRHCIYIHSNTMTTLEDLYYGNIHPNERFTGQSPRTDNLIKLIGKNEDELKESLTEKQKKWFAKK